MTVVWWILGILALLFLVYLWLIAPAGKKPAKPRSKPEKVTEKAPEKPLEEVPEPEQTPPWEEPPAEKAPDKLDEVAAQGRQLENFKIK